MAVAFDAVGPSSAGTGTENTTSINWSHTCSGSDRLLVVGVGMGGPSARTLTATFNSVSMTSAGLINANNQTAGYAQLFYLINPPTGTNTVVVTVDTSTVDLTGGSISFTGVDQTTPLTNITTNFGDSGSPSVTVTSAVGNMVVDVLATGNGGLGITSGQTLRWSRLLNNNSAAGNSAQSTAAGAASVNMSYTVGSDWWGILGANVVASAEIPVGTPIAWLTN